MTKLFAGPEAISSILAVTQNTDSKLIQKTLIYFQEKFVRYEPWMSTPTGMLPSDFTVSHWDLKERYPTERTNKLYQKFVRSLNQVDGQIPSTEKYNLYISEPSRSELDQFRNRIQETEIELIRIQPFFGPLIQSLIHSYVPMENPSDQHEFDYGMSVLWLKGCIFYEKRLFATLERRVENLAHEIAHQILIHYQLNDFLIVGDLNTQVYSGIRSTERPAIMAFHGAAALCYMLLVAKTYGEEGRIQELGTALRGTLESLKKIQFTEVGRQLFEEMNEFA